MLAAGGRLGVAAHAPALRSAACAQHSRLAAPALAPVTLAPAARLGVVCYSSSKPDKSWGDIAAEAVQVAKDVAVKIKDTASAAVEALTAPKQQQQQTPSQQRERERAPLYRPPEDDRSGQFPVPPGLGGGLFGGLVGGLLNQAAKGLASQLEAAAAESRSVSDEAAARIEGSSAVRQRLGRVTVGPAMSQSMSSQAINGRVTKSVSLIMPVYNSAGAPVAQAQVTSTEGGGQQQQARIVVRLPGGGSVTVDDNEPFSSSGRGGIVGDQEGEVVEAEFKDLK